MIKHLSRRERFERELTESEILTEISTLLSGISFAAILLVFQIKGNVEPFTIELLAGSLSFSCIFFLFFALCCILRGKSAFTNNYIIIIFYSAFLSFFVSLFLVLSLISQPVAAVSTILSVVLFILYFVCLLKE